MNNSPTDILHLICRFAGYYAIVNFEVCSRYIHYCVNSQKLINNMASDMKLNTKVFDKYHKYNETKYIEKLTRKIKKLSTFIEVTTDYIFHYNRSTIIVNDKKYKFKQIKNIKYSNSHKLLIVETRRNIFFHVDMITNNVKRIKYDTHLTVQYYSSDDVYFKCITDVKERKTSIYLINDKETCIFNNEDHQFTYINNAWDDKLFITQYQDDFDYAGVTYGYIIKDSKIDEPFYSKTNWCPCEMIRFPHQYKTNFLYYSLYDPGYEWEANIYSLDDNDDYGSYPFKNFACSFYDFKIYERDDKLDIQYNNDKTVNITNKYMSNSLGYNKNIIWYMVEDDHEHVYCITL